jgi:transcription elongation factor S-II
VITEKPSTSLNNNHSAKKLTLGATGDPSRDKIQQQLHKHVTAGLEGDLGVYAVELAVRIESVLFEWSGRRTDSKYKTKYRELAMNITDKNNPDLRDDLLSGILSVDDLIQKPITELASKQLKEARMAEQNEIWEARRTDLDAGKGMTDQWRCGKCGQRKVG